MPRKRVPQPQLASEMSAGLLEVRPAGATLRPRTGDGTFTPMGEAPEKATFSQKEAPDAEVLEPDKERAERPELHQASVLRG